MDVRNQAQRVSDVNRGSGIALEEHDGSAFLNSIKLFSPAEQLEKLAVRVFQEIAELKTRNDTLIKSNEELEKRVKIQENEIVDLNRRLHNMSN